ncbi:MAG: caspase family protein [Thermodesulfobacteriota bacterium]|nr:caspase family protein [Thermodesulfobacteriota bacterium]
MSFLFRLISTALFCLMAGVLHTPLMAKDLQGLQVIAIEGQFLDQAGRQVEEYYYIKPGLRYRLLPGATVELSTIDGRHTYLAVGPGIINLNNSGSVTLNGKPLSPQKFASSLKGVTATGTGRTDLGGILMRSPKAVHVVARTTSGGTKIVPLYAGYYALVVGCGAYDKGWPRLPNPVKDAREVASLLKGMGWHVDLLLDPDWRSLRKALNSIITGPGREKDKAVLLWFSGHGHTLAEADGAKLGYIVPVDAPNPDQDEMGFMENAISMRQIETVARRIQAKHVLMIFDSCFSGAIFQISRAKPPPFIQEKVAKPVRQFLTAGNEDEKVPDKSYFKTVFIQGVGDGHADRNKDGYITGQEIGAYLQEKVVNYSRSAQHPQYGKINNPKLDKGDFILVAKPMPEIASHRPVEEAGTALTIEKRAAPSRPRIVARKPLSGKVSVTSDVDGVEFRLAGTSFKTASSTALIIGDVPAGEHMVIAGKEGYTEWKGQVLVRPDRTVKLFIRLGPKSASQGITAEKDIKQMLQDWNDALNTRDTKKILALYADGARIMTKTKSGVFTVSKKRYAKIIKEKMRSFEQRGLEFKIDAPKLLEINGDRARVEVLFTVEMPMELSGYHPPKESVTTIDMISYFKFVNKGSRWLIDEYRFENL